MPYIAKNQTKWGKGSNPCEARRNAGIELREDHSIWGHDDPEIYVNKEVSVDPKTVGQIANTFVYGVDYSEPFMISEWRDGERIDRIADPPLRNLNGPYEILKGK